MIILTRYNGSPLMLNDEFIEIVEETPDTVVTMQNGHRYLVKEKITDIAEKSAFYRRQCSYTPEIMGTENIE